MTYHALGYVDLALAGALLTVNALLSWGFRLGMERAILIASVRMVVQLGAIGFILKFAFEQGSFAFTAMLAVAMIAVASWDAINRQQLVMGSRWEQWALGGGAMLFSGFIGTVYAVGLIIASDPWWTPRTLLPILGMVLGNSLTGVSLLLDTVATTTRRERPAIEARLALGATRFEAMRGVISSSLRTAMMPMINSMAAAGVVSLPGMMTGQILAGAEPVEAAKYQIMILSVLSGTTALGIFLAAAGALLLLTDKRHRLRPEQHSPAR